MTCGMLCVMRRERRGVLHLDKYSPPKAKRGSVEEERKREKEKRRRKKRKEKKKKEERQRKGEKITSSSLIYEQRSCSSEQIYASRGRGSLQLWLIFITEP